MGVRTHHLNAHPSNKPFRGIILDWRQSGSVIWGEFLGGPIRTSRVIRRYRLGRALFVETVNSVYELRFGLRWGRPIPVQRRR